MESSIPEFLMRQLAFEQLPTQRACEHDAYRASRAPGHRSPHRQHCALERGLRAQPNSRATVSVETASARNAPLPSRRRAPQNPIPSRPFGYDQV